MFASGQPRQVTGFVVIARSGVDVASSHRISHACHHATITPIKVHAAAVTFTGLISGTVSWEPPSQNQGRHLLQAEQDQLRADGTTLRLAWLGQLDIHYKITLVQRQWLSIGKWLETWAHCMDTLKDILGPPKTGEKCLDHWGNQLKSSLIEVDTLSHVSGFGWDDSVTVKT
ncbi:hypothetical protein B0H10DRAFT_2189704 [Mycena sp. CBHHK59/15]|nr:hypothetical protein B0H10DRAFT_2189704 [Mycena sp. CBHHK59/15]